MTTDSERPPVWVGHIVLRTRRQKESEAFMRALGMRFIVAEDDAVILELRGGTHLILLDVETGPGPQRGRVSRSNTKRLPSDAAPDASPGDAPFDLMVDDIEATHRICTGQGLSPTDIETGSIHRTFFVTEPSGHRIKFFDSHVSEFAV